MSLRPGSVSLTQGLCCSVGIGCFGQLMWLVRGRFSVIDMMVVLDRCYWSTVEDKED